MKNDKSFDDNKSINDNEDKSSTSIENIEELNKDNEAKSLFKDKKTKYLLMGMISLLLCVFTFIIVYEISYKKLGTTPKVESKDDNVELANDTVVILQSNNGSKGYNIDKIYTVAELKNQYKLSGDVTKKEIEGLFEKQNYTIQDNSNVRLVFNRVNGQYVKGKYYIGDKDGYIAIYKCNDEGQLVIEDEKNDVSNSKTENLDEESRDIIMNFKKSFDTKEDAEEAMTEFTT